MPHINGTSFDKSQFKFLRQAAVAACQRWLRQTFHVRVVVPVGDRRHEPRPFIGFVFVIEAVHLARHAALHDLETSAAS